jgi:hypothetical protein
VVNTKHELSIVILTEDSGKDGRKTVEALVRAMLQLVVPGYGSQRIHFVPRDGPEEEAMRGNLWKADGKNPQDHGRCVRLLRHIARQLSLRNTFVVFHIDGDRPWNEHGASENTAKFEKLIRRVLPQVVDRGRANVSNATGRRPAQPAALLQLEHLILICPFRSIEAWLYQNVPAAVAVCTREHGGRHIAELQSWKARRDALDELPAPDQAVCLGKQFNLELTRGFPARATYDVNKSFARSVDRLKACRRLVVALEGTR